MSKHFRPWNIDQTLLLPPSVQDFVPKDHVSRFLVGLVRESLDFKLIFDSWGRVAARKLLILLVWGTDFSKV